VGGNTWVLKTVELQRPLLEHIFDQLARSARRAWQPNPGEPTPAHRSARVETGADKYRRWGHEEMSILR